MFESLIHHTTRVIEIIGVLIIVGGAVMALFTSLRGDRKCLYDNYRKNLGRSILLGLEFLVVADIINTVAVEPTLQNVSILGLIVLIRTFLSFSLEIELERRLPWKERSEQNH